jgi:ribonuclease P protein component
MDRSYRIKKNEQFQDVFKNRRSFANRQFVVYYLQKPDHDHFRFGLSVSKRIGNAVTRNRIKRYIKEVLNEFRDELLPDYDYVIIARKPVSTMNYHEIKSSLLHVLKRAKVLSK